jgi:GH15 family glucan-1,4-alpha-glucosidase
MLADLADRCCDRWLHEDAGLWELGDQQHYTVSKMGCWIALDRALQLHERGQIATGHAGRWAAERDRIRSWVEEHCWSEDKNAYTFYAGTDDLDAATLVAAWNGFDRGTRLSTTIDAIRAELGDGPLVYRYSGMQREEGAFLACTFWRVSALAKVGRVEEARQLMDEAVELANDVGLLSEQMAPSTRTMLGNFPQGLSHLALINAAVDVSAALRGD